MSEEYGAEVDMWSLGTYKSIPLCTHCTEAFCRCGIVHVSCGTSTLEIGYRECSRRYGCSGKWQLRYSRECSVVTRCVALIDLRK